MRDYPDMIASRFSKAVFLDRDGTINVDTHYTHKIGELQFVKGSLEALKILASMPVHVIIVSNQAGIALGYYTVKEMHDFNMELIRQVALAGGRIDGLYYCPEREFIEEGSSSRLETSCAKPSPKLLFDAAGDFDISLKDSVIIGDKTSDVAAGKAAGTKAVLVETGKGGKEDGALDVTPDRIACDLLEAVSFLRELGIDS